MKTHENIKYLREKKGMSQEELALKVGYKDRSSVAKVEAGLVDLAQSKIAAFAAALSVTPAQLMGLSNNQQDTLPHNLTFVPQMQKIPLVGAIACGTPILAEENIEDYVDLPSHIHADYALVCKGDSMVNAGIQDGDVVYIRKQEQVENGQIAAVLVGEDEATLKRFYYDGKMVQLVAENPAYPPKVFYGEEMQYIRVIGLAIAYTHAIQ